jgi:hypothetical protein
MIMMARPKKTCIKSPILTGSATEGFGEFVDLSWAA